jgi:hypothetical protein
MPNPVIPQTKTGARNILEIENLQQWACLWFKEGTMLGDIARADANEINENEYLFLSCAYEGFLIGENH